MIMAMFAFLVVSMVSVVIINAAMTNAARVKNEHKYEQAYLTAQMLAGVLQDKIVVKDVGDSGKSNKYISLSYSAGSETTVAKACEGTGAIDSSIANVLLEFCKARREQVGVEPLNAASVSQVSLAESHSIISFSIDETSIAETSELISQVNESQIMVTMPAASPANYDLKIYIRVPLETMDESGNIIPEADRVYYTTCMYLESRADIKTVGSGDETTERTYVYWDRAVLEK